MAIEDRITDLIDSRFALLFATAFVCWRHTLRKLMEERRRYTILSAHKQKRLFKQWMQHGAKRGSYRISWIRLVQMSRRLGVQKSYEAMKTAEEQHANCRQSFDNNRASRLFVSWKQSSFKARVTSITSSRMLEKLFLFWKALWKYQTRGKRLKLQNHMLSWHQLTHVILRHKFRLKSISLLIFLREIISKNLATFFHRWRGITAESKQEHIRTTARKCLSGWFKRREKNSVLSLNFRVMFHRKFLVNFFRSWLKLSHFLSFIDRWRSVNQQRTLIRHWSHWTHVERPRVDRIESRIRKIRLKNVLNRFFVKWIAMTACYHRHTVRAFLAKRRMWLRWLAFRISRREQRQRELRAKWFHDTRRKKFVIRGLSNELEKRRWHESVIVPNFNNSWIQYRVWMLWTTLARPSIQQELIVDRKITRFRSRALLGKAMYVFSVHTAEQALKNKERLRDRLILAYGARRIYGKSVLEILKKNAKECEIFSTLKSRSLRSFLRFWEKRLVNKQSRTIQWRIPTIKLSLFRLRNYSKLRSVVYRNLRLKFFDRWVQFVCDSVGELIRTRRVTRLKQHRMFLAWKRLTCAVTKSGEFRGPGALIKSWQGIAKQTACEHFVKLGLVRRKLKLLISIAKTRRAERMHSVDAGHSIVSQKNKERPKRDSTDLVKRVVTRWRLFAIRSRERKEEQLRVLTCKVENLRRHLVALRE